MRKVLSFFAVLMVFAATVMAQAAPIPYQCGIVDNADAIFGIDVANFVKAPAIAQIKQMLDPILKNDAKDQADDLKEVKSFFKILGITADNYDKVLAHTMVTVSFNGASMENPDPAKLDVIVAALLTAPVNFDKVPEAIKSMGTAEDLKTISLKAKQYPVAKAFELVDLAEDRTPGMDKFTIAMVGQDTIFAGPTRSVEKALNRVSQKQLAKNMDPFLFGQDGQVQFAIRMFPEMKQNITAMAASIPGAAQLANSKGMAILFNATDKFTLNVNLQTAKPEDAATFKKQVWDVQVAPMVGAFSQMAKAQTNNQLTALDSIKCTVNGAVLGVSASFTLNDIILGVAAVQKMQAQSATKPAAVAPAQQAKDAAAAAGEEDDEEDDDDEEEDGDDEE